MTVLSTLVIMSASVVLGALAGCAGRSASDDAGGGASAGSAAQLAASRSPAASSIAFTDGSTSQGAILSGAGAAHVFAMSADPMSSGPRPRDAAAPLREFFKVDAYQFTAPIGDIGRNEDFWKRIDEQCVDVGTYDLLFKNGLRVGVAPMSEFSTIQKHLDVNSSCKKITINGVVAQKVQLETRKDLTSQTIFYFDGGNNAIGRSYDRCTNLIDLSFEPTPRVPGSLRVNFAPEVRANRTQLEFTVLNNEREFSYVQPETFYDLNCRADIPKDEFLILAPSSDADRLTSVGHAFLTTDASPRRMEQVIVLVPHVMMERIGEPTITPVH